jgi:hypothetical protein
MKIDYTPLEKTIEQMDVSLQYATSVMAQQDAGLFSKM